MRDESEEGEENDDKSNDELEPSDLIGLSAEGVGGEEREVIDDVEQGGTYNGHDGGGYAKKKHDRPFGFVADEGEFEEVVGKMDDGGGGYGDGKGEEEGKGGHEHGAETKAREKGEARD